MTESSQNGWPIVTDRVNLRHWTVKGTDLPLRLGSPGFVLAHLALWFELNIEPLNPPSGDDFAWSLRKIGGTETWSNHASATAVDLNATKHPQGQRGTFDAASTAAIRRRCLGVYRGLIKWGGDFHSTPDEMHFELQGTRVPISDLSTNLHKTPLGRILMSEQR